METYSRSISHFVEGLSSESPDIILLRRACESAGALTRLHTKIKKLSDTNDSNFSATGFDLGKSAEDYNAAVEKMTELSTAKRLDVKELSASVDASLKLARKFLDDMEVRIERIRFAEEERQREELNNALEKERLDKARRTEEERALKLRKERMTKIANQNSLTIKNAVDRFESWKKGVISYSKFRFPRLLGSLFGTIAVVYMFISWRAGPPGIILLTSLAVMVGPFSIKGLTRKRLRGSDASFTQFDSVLAWQIGLVVGLFQILSGVVISLTFWIFNKPPGLLGFLIPLGWSGIAGYLIVLPCILLVAWLYGGFFLGVVSAKLMRKGSIVSNTNHEALKLTCPDCESEQEVATLLPIPDAIACKACAAKIVS
jgi:hypothetical protein